MHAFTRRALIGSLVAAILPATVRAAQPGRSATPATSPILVSPPEFAIGVTVYVKGSEAGDRAAIRHLISTRAAAGDSAICLVIPFTQDRFDNTEPRLDDEITPSLRDLRYIVREAHGHDISVMLKPLMDERRIMETGPAGTWRGTLQPRDPEEWFANYAALIEPWAHLAVDERCAWFVIGSEFTSLEAPIYDRYWDELIARIRGFAGSTRLEVTYGQNWDRIGEPPDWLAELDFLSVDAYYPLHGVSEISPVDALVDAFQEHAPALRSLRDSFPDKRLYFTEVGISSTSNMYSTPWGWGSAGQDTNLEAQRKFFEAACQFYGSVGEGIFWWVADIHPIDDPLNDSGFQFIGKPAEDVVNQCSASHRA